MGSTKKYTIWNKISFKKSDPTSLRKRILLFWYLCNVTKSCFFQEKFLTSLLQVLILSNYKYSLK